VLHAIPGKHLDRTVIHLDREIHCQLALTVTEDQAHGVVEPEQVRRDRELLDGNVKEIAALDTWRGNERRRRNDRLIDDH